MWCGVYTNECTMNREKTKELYEKYAYLIYGRCRTILRDEADAWDAVQEVFLKLTKHYDSMRDKSKVVSWIFTAAKNHCFNELRRRKKFDTGAECDEIRGNERTEERIDARDVIRRILSIHNSRVQDAVYYTYVEKLDQKSIQKVTGQSPATVRRNLKKFKDSVPSMRKLLEIE